MRPNIEYYPPKWSCQVAEPMGFITAGGEGAARALLDDRRDDGRRDGYDDRDRRRDDDR